MRARCGAKEVGVRAAYREILAKKLNFADHLFLQPAGVIRLRVDSHPAHL